MKLIFLIFLLTTVSSSFNDTLFNDTLFNDTLFNDTCISSLTEVADIFDKCNITNNFNCCGVDTRSKIRQFVADVKSKCDINGTIASGLELGVDTLDLVCGQSKPTSGDNNIVSSVLLTIVSSVLVCYLYV
ncbi:hypothetical protein EB118_11685 [bacterium]|nr:hypothetical protein [bacterium]NDC94901.1 hypothetical protein [bacterium]NDD84639.1 hypothetical protein [bacterium]NDG30720.1 hypothetical protein [bacterium]